MLLPPLTAHAGGSQTSFGHRMHILREEKPLAKPQLWVGVSQHSPFLSRGGILPPLCLLVVGPPSFHPSNISLKRRCPSSLL